MSKRKKSSHKQAPQACPGTSRSSALNLIAPAGVAIIIIVAIIAYFPSLSGGFLLDDEFLTNNSLIKAADGLYRFWCTTEAQDYWPVTNTTFWIEWRLWGMNPTGYHVTNLILHIIEALLIWIILRKLSIPGAFLGAVIFAVHPVNVESVAWIAQRKNLMAMLFFLLSILCYLRQFPSSCSDDVRSRHTLSADPAQGECGLLTGRWYWLSLLAFVLAMLSKGSAAVLPVLLLGIVWWLRTGTVPIFASAKMGLSPSVSRWDLARTGPFFLVALVLAGVNVWFQTHGTEIVIRSASFAQRLLGAGGVVWFYLYKALLPLNLAFVYPQWHIEVGNPLWWLPLVAAVVVTMVLWLYRKSWSRPFLFAWGFFCVGLAPMMGFVDVGYMQYSLVADHYQHIAIIGVIALASALWSTWHRWTRGGARWAATVVGMAVVGIFILLSWRQSGMYSDAMTLYQATLEKNQDCWMAYYNLGNASYRAGRLQEAIEHYQQALTIKSDYPEAHNNLGAALAKLDRPQEAIEHLEQTLRLKPDYPEAHNNLGLALDKLGRYPEAIEHYRQALRLKPDYPEAHNNLGLTLDKSGRYPEAIEHYRQALRLKPDYPEAHNNLGLALDKSGRYPEAVEHYRQALRLKPDYPDAHNNLGMALGNAGRLSEAIEHYQQALRLKPNFSEAHNNLGLTLDKSGRYPEAVEHYRQALQLDPSFPEPHTNLGTILAKTGRLSEAIEQFEQALRLNPNSFWVHNTLGNVLADAGRPLEAINHYEEALRLNPNYPEALYNMGNTLVNVGRHQEAIDYYKQSLALNPNYPEALYNLGGVLMQTGQTGKAIEHFKQVLHLKPDFISAHFKLALAYSMINQSADAIGTAQKSFGNCPHQGNDRASQAD